mgnify:CR=1 FL=1
MRLSSPPFWHHPGPVKRLGKFTKVFGVQPFFQKGLQNAGGFDEGGATTQTASPKNFYIFFKELLYAFLPSLYASASSAVATPPCAADQAIGFSRNLRTPARAASEK